MTGFMYIEEPDDPELLAAWEALRERVGSLSGWQYGGSAYGPEGWQHSFRNRYLSEAAETEEAHNAASQTVPALPGWPQQDED